MTATLWAAHNGHLDALRTIVGRGGDIEKANYYFGQTALHLAAAKGHLNCVSFLVGFDANLWALDLDNRTPIQLATSREVLDYLDKAAAKQEHTNKKDVKAKKEKAIKDMERRRKKYEERIKKGRDKEEKRIKRVEKETGSKIESDIPIPTATNNQRKATIEDTKPTFTQIVGSGTLVKKPMTGVKKMLEKKLRCSDLKNENKSHTLNGQIKNSQIIYVNSYDTQNNGKRGRLTDVFDGRTEVTDTIGRQQSSIFDRPGFGSVAFRQRSLLAGTLSGDPPPPPPPLPGSEYDEDGENSDTDTKSSNGRRLTTRARQNMAYQHEDVTTSTDDVSIFSDDITVAWRGGEVDRFLASAGVEEYAPQLEAQRIDLHALLILTDSDLIQLGVPMGPRRKLLHAVERRKEALKNPGLLQDSKM
ncbi:hypothetical protein AAG570_004444 [Ranatra chinensis]|uniref:SAM domain-containing protein n=1 Tax=Ranatra chinensis TaxID=642074 RepID=A0ABD0Y0X6_9HEMI